MRRALLSCCALFFAVALLFSSPHFAFAAAKGAARPASAQKSAAPLDNPNDPVDCFYTPSDQYCDDTDPVDSSCGASAGYPTTVATLNLSVKYFVGGSDPATAVSIELRYSNHCASNWTRAYSYYDYDPNTGNQYQFYIAGANIVRDDGRNYPYYPGGSVTEAWTNMVYAPVRKAKACVEVAFTFTTPNGGGGGGGPGNTWYCTAFY